MNMQDFSNKLDESYLDGRSREDFAQHVRDTDPSVIEKETPFEDWGGFDTKKVRSWEIKTERLAIMVNFLGKYGPYDSTVLLVKKQYFDKLIEFGKKHYPDEVTSLKDYYDD